MRKLRVAIALPISICRIADSIIHFYSRVRFGRDFRLIPLTQGKFAVVDAEDYDRLTQHKWYAVKFRRHWYAARYCKTDRAKTPGRSLLMHRELLGQPADNFVDHINGNGLDNRKENLRIATKLQNSWNRKKRRGRYSSRFKGVSRRKTSGKWRAKITCDGKAINLGNFDHQEDAARAYDAKARELYGQFAKQNLP